MKDVGSIWRCGNLYRTAKLEKLGLGSYQDSYIVNVCLNPGITQDGLCKLIFVHKSNVARQLCALEEKGFVERRTDSEDKRVTRVYPTQKAIDVFDEVRAVQKEWNLLILSCVSEEERTVLEQLLKRVADKAQDVATGEQRQ